MDLVTFEKPVVFERDGKLWTTSLDVARVFGKEHKNVLSAIDVLDCSPEFTGLNFKPSDYKDSTGRTLPMVEMTEAGFTFLAMGFTGKKAAQFKEWYIGQFEKMKGCLKHGNAVLNQLLIQGKQNEERLVALMEDFKGGLGGLGHRVEKVETKVDEVCKELNGLKNTLPIKRRDLSKDTVKKHIECIWHAFKGVCPCCGETQIIGHNMQKLSDCQEDHFVNRHENSLTATWLICKDCNIGRSSGKIDNQECSALFKAYQVRLRMYLSKFPKQVTMASILQLQRKRFKKTS